MIDFIGIILLLLFFIRGFRKGIIVAVFALLGIILGIIISLKLSAKVGGYLMDQGWVTSAWAQIISYILLFIGVIWLVRLGAKLIEKTVSTMLLGGVNKIIGGLLYLVLGTIVWSSCLWLANQAHLLTPEAIAGSRTYSYLVPIAPWVFSHIGEVLPFAKNIFAELKHFFDAVNQHLPEHVGSHR